MIKVKLMGGLGNQMFQYAIGRSLSMKLHTQLSLDLSGYKNISPEDTPRHYELGCFNISANLDGEQINARFLKRVQRFLAGHKQIMIKEGTFSYNHQVLNSRDNSYLVGYWQSEKYFKDIRGTLLKDFSFKLPPSGKNAEILKTIRNTKITPISLHVRRGDYVSNQNANSFHGVSPIDYYNRAVEYFSKKIPNPHFFIFSDDPNWCSENLTTGLPTTYVTHNDGSKGYEDMRLMMNCKHHIIANSSFSWWGAWLNPSPKKIVVAPKSWFQDKSVNTSDIYADGWVKL